MKIRNKFFALFLSLAMFFAFMPTFAYADETPSAEGSGSGASATEEKAENSSLTNSGEETSETADAAVSIGDKSFATLPEAVAAAKDGDTITLLKDAEGSGVKLEAKDAKALTFDFGGHTYTMNGEAVGSTGYESQAMHFEKGAAITLKNGTLKVAGGAMGIQNYADLTLQDFNVDASMNAKCQYVMSNNNGDVKILGSSSIKAAKGQNAFDVCVTTHYPDGARVTVDTTGEIVGNIQYDTWGSIPENNKTALTIKNGKFDGTFDIEDALKDEAKKTFSISGGTFTDAAAENYLSDGFILSKSEDGSAEEISYSGKACRRGSAAAKAVAAPAKARSHHEKAVHEGRHLKSGHEQRYEPASRQKKTCCLTPVRPHPGPEPPANHAELHRNVQDQRAGCSGHVHVAEGKTEHIPKKKSTPQPGTLGKGLPEGFFHRSRMPPVSKPQGTDESKHDSARKAAYGRVLQWPHTVPHKGGPAEDGIHAEVGHA